MSEKDIKTLSPEVEAIAENLRKSAKINPEKNTVEFADDAFEANLPDGVSKGTIKQVEKVKQDFALAQTLVTGELAIQHLKDNEGLDKVTSKVALPIGASVASIARENIIRNVATGEEKVVHGYASTRIVTKVPARGILTVRARVGELADKVGLGK